MDTLLIEIQRIETAFLASTSSVIATRLRHLRHTDDEMPHDSRYNIALDAMVVGF